MAEQPRGITDYSVYLPFPRLGLESLGALLGQPMGGGRRTVASFDEDATTMAVEAARRLVGGPSEAIWFASTRPPFLDKTNATTIGAALRCAPTTAAYDVMGSVRSGVAALRAAATGSEPALAVLSDLRYGLPGSADLAQGGDGAAAFMFGEAPLAQLVATASVSGEYLDRWRAEGATGAQTWDARFAAGVVAGHMGQAREDVLKRADLAPEEIAHTVVSSPQSRALRQVRGALGGTFGELDHRVGYVGAADFGLQLAGVLDRAEPGDYILVLVGADGADALVFRATERIADYTPKVSLADAIEGGSEEIDPAKALTWRGLLDREPPRRPEPKMPAAPAALRTEGWKFGFVASQCEACDTRHLPPQRTCWSCGAVDRMVDEPMADVPGTIATYSIDRLAYSLSPPGVVAVIDFDGGGRYQCLLTDVDPDQVAIGDRIEMSFRLLDVAPNGLRNYFWKARPLSIKER